MKGRRAAATVVFAFATQAYAKPPPSKPPARPPQPPPAPHVEPRPPPPPLPLPMLASVARVELDVARDHVVLVEEINLPRGDWKTGGLDLYAAFGAPGVPIAVDARLFAALPDSSDPPAPDAGGVVSVEPAARRWSGFLLLGRPQMAGVVLRVKEADLKRAFATSDLAVLRIRSLLTAPAADPDGVRDVVVRLGIAGDLPLTLGRIEVVSLESRPWITRVEATLCGPEAEGRSLSVMLTPKAAVPADDGWPIAPPMAVRHASDDLCIRWWAAP